MKGGPDILSPFSLAHLTTTLMFPAPAESTVSMFPGMPFDMSRCRRSISCRPSIPVDDSGDAGDPGLTSMLQVAVYAAIDNVSVSSYERRFVRDARLRTVCRCCIDHSSSFLSDHHFTLYTVRFPQLSGYALAKPLVYFVKRPTGPIVRHRPRRITVTKKLEPSNGYHQ